MSTVTATVKTVDYLESRLAIEWWESGSGDPPMLLMHGGNGFSPAPPYVEMLCQSQRVIAAQHPGYGDSERPGWMDTVSDLAHFYLELIESEGLEDVTLVGFSSGGWIAAEMAVWRPQRIGRVVLVDAVIDTGLEKSSSSQPWEDSLVNVPVASSVPVELQRLPVCVPALSGTL